MFLTDALALSHVPRWAIVSTIRPQYVSDHTFRVAIIFIELTARLDLPWTSADLLGVLIHDLGESRTGDIPTPVKRELGMKELPVHFSSPEIERVYRLADLIEAYTFIRRYGEGEHAHRVAEGLSAKIAIEAKDWGTLTSALIDDILQDIGR